jgi:cell division protein FtsN
MSSGSGTETEILLGNKHLLAIFFVIAVLLGIAFTGGYMVGRTSFDKKTVSVASMPPDPVPAAATAPANSTAWVTKSVGAAPAESTAGDLARHAPSGASVEKTAPIRKTALHSGSDTEAEIPLGARKKEKQPAPAAAENSETANAGYYAPQNGQMFLQVAAVGRNEADAVADVLHKKGFPAHSVAKPGNANIYRVLIGPIRDSGDLSSTRDSLRKTGFREVIVQRY